MQHVRLPNQAFPRSATISFSHGGIGTAGGLVPPRPRLPARSKKKTRRIPPPGPSRIIVKSASVHRPGVASLDQFLQVARAEFRDSFGHLLTNRTIIGRSR